MLGTKADIGLMAKASARIVIPIAIDVAMNDTYEDPIMATIPVNK